MSMQRLRSRRPSVQRAENFWNLVTFEIVSAGFSGPIQHWSGSHRNCRICSTIPVGPIKFLDHCRIKERNVQCKLKAIIVKESTSGQHVELGKHGYEILAKG